jgi:hypothetical protein
MTRLKVGFVSLAVLLAGLAITVSIYVQIPVAAKTTRINADGGSRALVLYHPDKLGAFTDDLSSAIADELAKHGFDVMLHTMTPAQPPDPRSFALVAVVSNTYYWAPDRPTRKLLEELRFDGVMTIGLIGGAGSTDRAQRLFVESLRSAGAELYDVRAFWILRPNDETRLQEPNRGVAIDMARRFAAQAAAAHNSAGTRASSSRSFSHQ